MDDIEFVAFDLETTGLHPAFCRIVEFGAVRFRADGTELGRMEQLVNPGCPVPRRATAVHGITDDRLRGQPSVEQVLPEFLRFLGDEDTVLMAHNAAFDLGFLSVALSRTALNVPQHPVVDTLALSRQQLRQLANHQLETVSRHLRVADFTAHRALGDALVVKSVFLRLLDRRPAVRSVAELLSIARPMCLEPAGLVFSDVPAGYEPLAEAIEVGQSIVIVYEGGTKGHMSRRITPRGLIESKGVFYVIAHCHIDEMEKHFRLDRILQIEGT